MKQGAVLSLISVLAILMLTSCGRVDISQVQGLCKDMPYTVEITVDVASNDDPKIFVKAKEIEVDKSKKEISVVVKSVACVTDVSLVDEVAVTTYFAITVSENTKFSVPLGGKVSIYKDGKLQETIEHY